MTTFDQQGQSVGRDQINIGGIILYLNRRNWPTQIRDWEYKDFVWTFTSGGINLSNFGGYTMAGARHEVWSECQSAILSDLQQDLDNGWEPIGEIGPTALKFRDTLRLNWGAYIVAGIFTMGIGLLAPFFFLNTWAIPVEFRVRLRRPK
jgi:hypothetical protein